jgi:ferredoxin--NADP+ reductase
MSKWVKGTVAGNVRWTDRLHSLQVDAPEVTFVAGQFGRLALPAPPGSKEEMLGRPYSFVNAPDGAPTSSTSSPSGGPLSPQLATLSPGDPIWLLRNANGFFTINEVPAADVLWCLATGTGLVRSCRS